MKTLTIIHINLCFKETTPHGRFVGTHPRRVAQVLLSGHLLHNVQVHCLPKHPPEEVKDTVCAMCHVRTYSGEMTRRKTVSPFLTTECLLKTSGAPHVFR